jgi:hypothetical protein
MTLLRAINEVVTRAFNRVLVKHVSVKTGETVKYTWDKWDAHKLKHPPMTESTCLECLRGTCDKYGTSHT